MQVLSLHGARLGAFVALEETSCMNPNVFRESFDSYLAVRVAKMLRALSHGDIQVILHSTYRIRFLVVSSMRPYGHKTAPIAFMIYSSYDVMYMYIYMNYGSPYNTVEVIPYELY